MFQHLSFCEICRTVRSVDSWIMLSYFLGFWGIIYAGAAVLIRTPTYIYQKQHYIDKRAKNMVFRDPGCYIV